MKKITLLNVQKWVYDNLKESGGNEYYISLYDSLADYVSDASDDPDIWDYLRTVLDQYGRFLNDMLQDPDPIAILSHSGGSVDKIDYLYESIYNNEISFSQIFDNIENGYYLHDADKLDKILYALHRILKDHNSNGFYNLEELTMESDGLYIRFGVISESICWTDVELEVFNMLDAGGVDPHDSEVFKNGLKRLALKVVDSLEFGEYIPKGYFR